MAYGNLPVKAAGDTLTLGNYDQIRDNFDAGVPDIFTTKGDLAAATGSDSATRIAVGAWGDTLVADGGEAGGMRWQIQPGARVYNSGDIDPTPGSWVTLTFDSERYDQNGMHGVAEPARLIAPANGGGIYSIGGCVLFDSSGEGAGAFHAGLRIRYNGTTVIAQIGLSDIVVDSNDYALTINTIYALAATDYVTLQVYTEANIDILADGNYSPAFWAQWLRL